MRQKHISYGAIALLGLLGATAPAWATITFTDDTTLASPNTSPATPGNEVPNGSWYNGTGNPQGAFAVAVDDTTGIELGLRAILRGVGTVTPAGNTYTFSTGTASGKALWNYEFSIDLNPGDAPTGGLTFATAGPAVLTVTDLTTSATGSFDPTAIPDDSAYGDPTNGDTSTSKHKGVLSGDWGMQNSENLSFGFPLPGFNPWNGDTYQITLSIDGNSDSILVNTVPEPASLSLLAFGLLGIGAVRRRLR